jgi:hypothetical protein
VTLSMIFAAKPPEEILYGYGPLGIGVVALAFIGYKLFKIILADRDKALADKDLLVQDIFTKVLPAITRNTELLEQRQQIDRDLIEVVRESNKQLEANTKTFDELRYRLGPRAHIRSGGV